MYQTGISHQEASLVFKDGDRMRIGFAGAGKVGFTLGRYFTERSVCVSGYYSLYADSALEASQFTHTSCFNSLQELADASDVIFLTVPDGQIETVWNSLKGSDLKGKVICHCSGALSSAVFSEIDRTGAYGYSIHPLFAVSDRLHSWREISNAYFTIEGSSAKMDMWRDIFARLGNPDRIITADNKTLYHAAAVFASNLVVGLYEQAMNLMVSCGFGREDAGKALAPLFLHNCEAVAAKGTDAALTGPVERNDLGTVEKHLKVLPEEEREVYIRLSQTLTAISQRKYPDRDYEVMSRRLSEEKGMEKS